MVGLAIYVMRFQLSSLVPSLDKVSMSKLLLTSGIIITCISFLGFIGALKENRCFLLTVRLPIKYHTRLECTRCHISALPNEHF